MTAGSPGDIVMPPRFLARILTVLALLSVATSAAAQTATPMPPAAAGGGGISLVASGLAAPRGMAWDPGGGMYVALAGSAGDMPGQGAGMGQSTNSNKGGPTAGIVKIVAGCGVPVATGLPSSLSGSGNYRGVAGVAFIGSDLFALVQGGGAISGNPDQNNGIYRISSMGDTVKITDLPNWMAVNPVANIPPDFTPIGDPFSLITGENAVLAVEANSGQVLEIQADGNMTRVADLSKDHPVPTGLARDHDGNLYVGYLTEAPYTPETSRVDKIAPDGTVSTVWTGLTQVTGVAVGADGTLYALEMSAGNGLPPGTGRLVKQTGPDSNAEIVTGLDQPVGLAIGPDGAFYITFPSTGPDSQAGGVIRVDPATTGPVAYNPGAMHAVVCGDATQGVMEATPVAAGETAMASATETPSPVVRVASALSNPRGMVWDADGNLYVAQSGTGETATSVGVAGSVVKIEKGCAVPVASGLPSSFDPFRDVMGPEDITILDEQLYVVQGATGPLESMDPKTPNGVYRVDPGGKLTLIADLTSWLNNNPVENPPPDRNPLGEPFRILPDNSSFWVVDSNSGEVDRVGLDGTVSRLADTSQVHHVVTALAPAPGGGVYIGYLEPAPHPDGASAVVKITADGQLDTVWSGLTAVTGIVVAPDGSLYASEMATGNETNEGMRPNTGRVVRQTGPASLEEVVTGLNYPIDLEQGPDGDLYVAGPAYGGNDRDGWILKIEPSITTPYAVPADLMSDGHCAGDDATPQADLVPTAAPPMVTPTPEAMPLATDTPPAASDAATPAGADDMHTTVAVEIKDYAFTPPTLTVPAGTTVTWTNNDAVPHTATASDASFDSGNLNPGQSYSFTFATPGSYPYACQYHAGMTGTIVVQ
jgi:plastocyanin/sugar lactone lactonase YvrE